MIRLTIGVVAALAACGGPTSVRPFGGAYTLITINGRPEPQPLYRNTNNPQIAGGALTVGPDTLYFDLALQPVDANGRAVGDTVSFEARIPYSRLADSLLLEGEGLGAGTIVGSGVRLVLESPANSTGFTSGENAYLFAPR